MQRAGGTVGGGRGGAGCEVYLTKCNLQLTKTDGSSIMVGAVVIGGVCVLADTCYKLISMFVVKRPPNTAPPLTSAIKVFAVFGGRFAFLGGSEAGEWGCRG